LSTLIARIVPPCLWTIVRAIKSPRPTFPVSAIGRFLAMLPMAVPGLVLGPGDIFFFNAPSNPFNPI